MSESFKPEARHFLCLAMSPNESQTTVGLSVMKPSSFTKINLLQLTEYGFNQEGVSLTAGFFFGGGGALLSSFPPRKCVPPSAAAVVSQKGMKELREEQTALT